MTDNGEFEPIPDEQKPLDPNYFWNPRKNVNDPRSIEGEVMEKRTGKYGVDVVLDTTAGKRQTPSHKQLQSKLEKVNPGQYIRVELKGQKSNDKGNPTLIYEVSVKKGYTPKPKDQPANNGQDPVIASIMADLKFAQGFFNGPIPEQNTLQCIKKFCMGTNAGKETELLQTLKTKGLVVQNAQGYQVV